MDKNGIMVESGKDLIFKARGNVKTEGMGIESKSKQDTKINGLNIEVSAQMGVKEGVCHRRNIRIRPNRCKRRRCND